MTMVHFRPPVKSESVRQEILSSLSSLRTEQSDTPGAIWNHVHWGLRDRLLNQRLLRGWPHDDAMYNNLVAEGLSELLCQPFFSIITHNGETWRGNKPLIMDHLESEWARLGLPNSPAFYGMNVLGNWSQREARRETYSSSRIPAVGITTTRWNHRSPLAKYVAHPRAASRLVLQ